MGPGLLEIWIAWAEHRKDAEDSVSTRTNDKSQRMVRLHSLNGVNSSLILTHGGGAK